MKANYLNILFIVIISLFIISSIDAQQVQTKISKKGTSILIPKKPLMEDFTSSTCHPCAVLNEDLIPWAEEHEGEFMLLKYPVNWPGVGDPYYTSEIGNRVDYYNVTGVPSVHINATYAGWQFEDIIPYYEAALNEESSFDIASSFSMSGSQITINTHILAYAEYDDLKVHTVVFEKTTEGNIGTNGETEFHHVVMKMLPSFSGAEADFLEYESYDFSQTANLSLTYIEDFNDLGVVIFIQNDLDMEVYQSDYSLEDANYSDDASLSSILVDGQPIQGFSPDIYEYDVVLPESPSELPAVSVELAEENAQSFIYQCEEIPGDAQIKVFAEDLAGQQNYTVHFTIGTITDELIYSQSAGVYPNPSEDVLNIRNWDQLSKVEILTMDGRCVYTMSHPTKTHDISYLQAGVYLVKLYQANSSNFKMEKLILSK